MGNLVLAGSSSGSTTITPASTGTYTITLPAETGTIQTSGAGFTTNGVAYATSTSALATGSALTFDGTNLGIGTSSPLSKVDARAANATMGNYQTIQAFSTNTATIDYGGGISLGGYYSGTSSIAQFASISGRKENGTAGNYAGYLQFGTNSQATGVREVMRLDSDGNLLVGTTSVDGAGSKVQLSSSGNRVFTVQNTANVNGDQALWVKLGSNCNTTASPAFICDTGGTNRLIIWGNGNVVNSNNSYGSLSDAKLKENIVDASPKLADLMQVKVRNYNLKTDPDHKQLGVIAQELETVFPSMIDESPDRDADGNVLETTTKSVKYSVFVPMLIKSIQELSALVTTQSATITSLTERITALESA
jgi:hypothetical protein